MTSGVRRVTIFGGMITLALAASAFVALLPQLGHWINQPRIERDYLIGLVWSILLGLSLFFWPVSVDDRNALLRLWLARCVVTLGVMLIYEWKYSIDAYSYFQEANAIPARAALGMFSVGNGNDNIVGIASLIAAVVPDSYHALKVSFAMIGLLGVYCYYRAAVRFIGRDDRRILYILGLFPSIIFWSSILGKDPIQFVSIAVYALGVVGWDRTRRWRYVIPIALGVLVSASMRIWSGPILLIPLIVFLFQRGTSVARRVVFAVVAAAALSIAWSSFADYFRLQSTADLLTTADQLSRGWEGGSQTLQGASGFSDIGSMLRFAPMGMFTALFRPLPGEVLNIFGLIAGLESALLLLLAFRALRNGRGELVRDTLAQWAIALILVWALVYGYAAYNLGAVVRFQLQIRPVLLLLLLWLGQKRASAVAASSETAMLPTDS